MRDYFQIKINFCGGIASPGHLKQILAAAWAANVRKVRFGARQQLIVTVHYEDMRFFEADLKKMGAAYETNTDRFPNIISSYCGEEVFRTGQWLNAGEYHAILDTFDFQPRLKINISDSNQSFTPFFTGNLNFISSTEPHFWFLYIRPKQSNAVFKWKELVYTNEIGRLSQVIEKLMLDDRIQTEDLLHDLVREQLQYVSQPAATDLELPSFTLPYYEGFNRYESRTWLGLYRRDEQFPIGLLLDICTLCLQTRIGEICTTPWKSIIIKGIEDHDRPEWSNILGRHNINVRHAANELAWQTEDYDDGGSALKARAIRYFEKNDTRTFGLCFGIQTRSKSEVFGSILIRQRHLIKIGNAGFGAVYDVYHTQNFNPNSRTHILFQKGLFGIHLNWQLERLCRRFNNLRTSDSTQRFTPVNEQSALPQRQVSPAFQCPDCYTIYDPEFGDERSKIAAGTAFADLPAHYTCPTCDLEKSAMMPYEIVQTSHLATHQYDR